MCETLDLSWLLTCLVLVWNCRYTYCAHNLLSRHMLVQNTQKHTHTHTKKQAKILTLEQLTSPRVFDDEWRLTMMPYEWRLMAKRHQFKLAKHWRSETDRWMKWASTWKDSARSAQPCLLSSCIEVTHEIEYFNVYWHRFDVARVRPCVEIDV